MGRIESSDGRLTITIEDAGGAHDSQELYTAAIVSLINGTPTDLWEMYGRAMGDNENRAETFYAAVLAALTRHAVRSRLVEAGDAYLLARPVYDVVQRLIEDLREHGWLREPVDPRRADEDEE